MKTRYVVIYQGPGTVGRFQHVVFKYRRDARQHVAARLNPSDWRIATIPYHNGKHDD